MTGLSSRGWRFSFIGLGVVGWLAAGVRGAGAQEVRINEFVASNDAGLRDEAGVREDWIELHNRSLGAVDLAGWRLTDDSTDLARWIFPSRVLAPGEFIVVFASGKDRRPTTGHVHTNFRIDGGGGDFLALVRPDGVVADSFAPREQFSNLAYGWGADGLTQGYLTPTPKVANGAVFKHGLNEVTFSRGRGFYTEAPEVSMTASVAGSVIRYTTNGTRPTATTGLIYESPIKLQPDTAGTTRGTRRVRAAAFHPDAALQRVATHSYFFLNGLAGPATDGLVSQTNTNSSTQTTAIKNHATYGPLLGESLASLPAVSINLIPSIPGPTETPASVEFFHPSGTEPEFQIDCGIQAVGGHSIGSPKNNFRLYFRSQYGASTLDHDIFRDHPYARDHAPAQRFDRIALRGGSHDSFFWMGEPANPPMSGFKGEAMYLRTPVMDDLHLNMGHAAPHCRYVQLWMNGRYHGLYHWREYPSDDFMASYRGGSSDEYDFTNGANTSENGSATWQATWRKLRTAMVAGYGEAARWIDLPQFADFMILNFWAGNAWDWNPNQNWMAAGPKLPDRGGWNFFSYDNDVIWNDANANLTIPTAPYYVNTPRPGVMPPDGLMVTTATNDVTLMDHAEFRILFRDRVYKAFFHGGVLEPERAQSILDHRVNELRLPLVAETARWQPAAATRMPWDRDGEWMTEIKRIRDSFIPSRPTAVLNQIRARGWYPVEAPEFAKHGGAVASGTQLTVTTTTPGTEMYATLDGNDPRLSGGGLHPSAILITDPPPASFIVTGPVHIRVRARRTADAEWSALNEARFHTGILLPAGPDNLIISQIHYSPAEGTGPSGDEFVEVMNVSKERIDLAGCSFARGLDFTFAPETILFPGERQKVKKSDFRNGSGLAAAGERLTLIQPGGAVIRSVTYRPTLPWPPQASGTGHSLMLISPEKAAATDDWAAEGLHWRASTYPASTPDAGNDPSYPDWKQIHAIPSDDDDRDHDGLNSLIEYATGSDPDSPDVTGLPSLHETTEGREIWIWAATGRTHLTVHLENSRDLLTWTPAPTMTVVARETVGSREKIVFRLPPESPPGTGQHWRTRVTATTGEPQG